MMTQEEIKITELGGKKNPFRVPEGYFESFDERLFARLPQAKQTKVVSLRRNLWRYAAAVVVVLGVGSALYWNRDKTSTLAYSEEAAQEQYFNDALDYAMVNNMEIAAYLTEAE